MKDVRRLFTKIKITDGCWLWTGCTIRNGYGQTQWNGKVRYAHRVIYELLIANIPSEKVLDHLCRNRSCVRPDHLEITTNRENILRGVGCTAINVRKTHCPQGHEYTESNTRPVPSGGRACWTCRRFKNRLNHKKRRMNQKGTHLTQQEGKE